jgi:predicted amidohydrolase
MERRISLVYGKKGPIVESYNTDGFKDSFELLTLAVAEDAPEVIMTGEFLFTIDDILRCLPQIAEASQALDSDIILTPENPILGEHYEGPIRNWVRHSNRDIRERVKNTGFTIDTCDDDDYQPQSVSFVFGRDGLRHAIAKTLDNNNGIGLHRVPDRNYGISICYEFWNNIIDPESLKNMDLLFLPAAEDDFVHNRSRTLLRAGISSEVIEAMYNWSVPDDVETRCINWGPSKDIVQKSRVPVISANAYDFSTGVVYLPKNRGLKHAEYAPSRVFLVLQG